MKILIALLIVAYIPLALYVLNVSNAIGKITSALTNIQDGNFNERVRFHTSFKKLNKMGAAINDMITKFQETAERKQYLEEARKRMVSNISHDLRTPLTSMLGYIDAVKSDESLTEEEREKYLHIAHNKAMDLHKIMEEFFQLSKLEAEDVIMNIEKINLKSVLEEVLAGFYEDFVREGVTPEIVLPDSNILVVGDKICVQRVVLNLFSNALKYGKDGGFVKIKLRQDEDFSWVEISNGGKGIQQNDLPHVFERLYTSDKSRNYHSRGSGIGLAIAKRLVELQKGRILVDSIEGERTTFTFSLPLYKVYNGKPTE